MKNKLATKTMSDAELAKKLEDTRKELRTHRYEAAGSRPANPNAGRAMRKTIARILTEQRARAK